VAAIGSRSKDEAAVLENASEGLSPTPPSAIVSFVVVELTLYRGF
jgi:hypothetical protein